MANLFYYATVSLILHYYFLQSPTVNAQLPSCTYNNTINQRRLDSFGGPVQGLVIHNNNNLLVVSGEKFNCGEIMKILKWYNEWTLWQILFDLCILYCLFGRIIWYYQMTRNLIRRIFWIESVWYFFALPTSTDRNKYDLFNVNIPLLTEFLVDSQTFFDDPVFLFENDFVVLSIGDHGLLLLYNLSSE